MALSPEIRKAVMDMYPSSVNWHERVSKMPDKQVYAINKRNEEAKARNNHIKKMANDLGIELDYHNQFPVDEKPEEEYHQMDIWEWLIERGAYEQKAEGAN